MQLNYNNLQNIFEKNSHLSISEEEITLNRNKFDQLYKMLNEQNQGFTDLPFDSETYIKIREFKKNLSVDYTNIVILGIGGSILGPQVIYDSLNKSDIKVIFLDNVDPDYINQQLFNININKTLFLVQTKSGSTPETLAQYFLIKKMLIEAGLQLANHLIFVTDAQKSYLLEEARNYQIQVFYIPSNVGGRFSVLSSVGLVLSEFLNLPTEELLLGAKDIYIQTVNQDKYLVMDLATIMYLMFKKGKNTQIIMPYSTKLKSFGNWCVQLISESLGKEKNLKNKIINTGITPITSVGATDQHSILQLYQEGPNDKLFIFLTLENFENQILIPKMWESSTFDYLENCTFEQLINTEALATMTSLTESNRANINLKIPKLNAYNLGSLFMLFEISVSLIAQMLEINCFNQPGVERSKILTKEILSKR